MTSSADTAMLLLEEGLRTISLAQPTLEVPSSGGMRVAMLAGVSHQAGIEPGIDAIIIAPKVPQHSC